MKSSSSWCNGLRRAVALGLMGVLAACGGGGGGGGGEEVEPPPPPPGGAGVGADGVTIFWYPYDTNVAVGAISSVQQTTDGGVIGVGYQMNDFSSRQDIYLLKADASGTRQWQRRLALGTNARAHAVRQTADGGFIVVGTITVGGANSDAFLLKLDASGNTAAGWPKTFGGPGADEGFAVLPVNGGADGYAVAGQSSSAGDVNVYVLRTDANGAVVWQRSDYASYCPGGGEAAKSIVAAADGHFAVAGATGCFGFSGILLKVDAANGNEIWRRGYDAVEATATTFESVALAPDGGFILAGSTATLSGNPPAAGPSDALVVKTDSGGVVTWRRTYGGAENDWVRAIAAAADGGYFMVGYSRSFGGVIQDPTQPWQLENALLVRLTSDGNTLWQKIKGNAAPSSDTAGAISIAAEGGFVAGGSAGGVPMLAKFDKNGATVSLGSTDFSYTVPGTTGIVTMNNAVDVAAAGVRGLVGPRQVGGAALDLLIDAANAAPKSDYCTGGGSYAFTPAPPAAPAAGSSYALAFTNCVIGPVGDQERINGVATLAVDSLSGSLTAPGFAVQTTLTGVNLQLAQVGGTRNSQIAGGMRYRREAAGGAYSELSSSITAPSAQTLTFTESGTAVNRSAVVGPFAVRSSVQVGGASTIGATVDALTVVTNGYSFVGVVAQPLQASGAATALASGSFHLTATDASRVTVTVTDGTAALAVDANGDGTVDGTLTVPWESID